jgi:hypothetical protein
MNFSFLTGTRTIRIVKQLFKGNNKLSRLLPVFNKVKSDKRSDKFEPVPTGDFLLKLHEKLAEQNVSFTCELRGVNNSRIESNNRTQKHLVAIYPTFEGSEIEGIGRFSILVFNAADGTSRLVIASGFDVKACSNGCIWGEISYGKATKHIYITAEEIIEEAVEAIAEEIRRLKNPENEFRKQIKDLMKQEVSQDLQMRFAKDAFQIKLKENPALTKLDESKGEMVSNVDYESIIQHNWNEHQKPTLWNLFQNVQENLRGNLESDKKRILPEVKFTVSKLNDEGKIVTRQSKLRKATKRVEKHQAFNIELTDLALKYLSEEKAEA